MPSRSSSSGSASTSGLTKRSGPHVSSWSGTRPELLLRDPALPVPTRRRDEAAVEPVRPGVVRALQRLAPPGALAHDRAAVSADVEERAELVLLVAHDDDRNVADPRRRERSRLRHVAEVAHVLPRAAEDPLALELEHGRIRVPAPGQGPDVDRAHDGQASGASCGDARAGSGRPWVSSRVMRDDARDPRRGGGPGSRRSRASNLAWWESQVEATEENAERRTEAELALSDALADRELFDAVVACA